MTMGSGAGAQTPGAAPGAAGDKDVIDIPLSSSGQEYRDALGRSRIKTDLIFLHPDADETLPRDAAKPEPVQQSEDLPRYTLMAVLAAVLVAIVIFALRFAPNTTISMSSPEDRAREGNRRRRHAGQASDGPANNLAGLEFLNELRKMSDRKAALILLLKRALERAVEINGMALGRSQTAREILRKLPRSWDHYPALSRLVGFEERVQFGGHDLPEPVFQESLSLAEPLFVQEPRR
jgi:hypothetical protein